MQPEDMQVVGGELAFRWKDGTEQFIALETLRRFCPCAACLGEKDIFGTVYKAPERPYGPRAFDLTALHAVGGYAIQPVWGDGHNTGLFTWDWLRRLGEASTSQEH